MPEALTPDAEEVLRLVQGVVQPLLARGCATLGVSPAVTDGEVLYRMGPLIELVPSNPDAAPLEIHVGAEELTVSFGKFLVADLGAKRGRREEMLEEMLGTCVP